MRNTKTLLLTSTATVLAAAFTVSIAQAQKLDGLWFKLQLSARGHTVDESGNVDTFAKDQTMYVKFVSTGEPHEYNLCFWTQRDDVWTNLFNADSTWTRGKDEQVISDKDVTFYDRGEEYLDTSLTAFIDGHSAGASGVPNVTFEGHGIIFAGQITGGRPCGTFDLTGVTVDPAKLPFPPP